MRGLSPACAPVQPKIKKSLCLQACSQAKTGLDHIWGRVLIVALFQTGSKEIRGKILTQVLLEKWVKIPSC